jgi:Ca-activated chloride channel family protein
MIRLAHPGLLWLFWLALIALGVAIYALKRRKIERELYAGNELLSKLAPDLSPGKILLKAILLVLALVFVIFSAVDPQIGTKVEEVKRQGVDIIVAVDVSASMMAEDIKPNRLLKAKHELSGFIDRLKGDRIGIIAFAGDAFTQCPLTTDYSAAKMFTDLLDTSLIPIQGTAIAEAINRSLKSFPLESKAQKVLVIITDGEDHEAEVDKAVASAKEAGVTIFTVGMGTPSGAPVPGPGGYLEDRTGSVVLTKLNEGLLTDMALETGGGYFRGTTGEDELDKIYKKIFGMEKSEISAKKYTAYEDRFQYFAFVALILLLAEILISERRGAWSKFFKLD